MTKQEHVGFDRQRFEELLAQQCNGAISTEGVRELEDIIRESSEARELYWKHISLHSSLSWTFRGKRECDRRLMILDESDLDTKSKTVSKLERVLALPTYRYWLPLVLAASLLIALFTGNWSGAPREERAVQQTSANMDSRIQTLGVISPISSYSRWSLGRPGERDHDELRVGDTLWLDQGIAELSLHSGTVIQLEAPLVFSMDDIARGRLLRGRITVDVPEGEKGFVVDTSAAKVVDLGTTFAVDVMDSGDTDFIVFKGEIDVDMSQVTQQGEGANAVATRRLQTGEALRVTEDGTTSRITNVRRTVVSAMPHTPPVIREVRDNILRNETMKYYEIVSGGMAEDVRAYVDRDYEWNGIDENGIPPYLVGGDYVKTFNDDKVTSHLQIHVTLDQPATIYLLVDDRLEQTEWLTNRFVDTGDDIGVDEGPRVEDDHRLLGKGAGVSIDHRYSVWRYKATADSIVTVGPFDPLGQQTYNVGLKAKLSMYGIVAVPAPKSSTTADPDS